MDADRLEGLEQAERRLQAAQLASDVTALGELLDEDAIFTPPSSPTWPNPGNCLPFLSVPP